MSPHIVNPHFQFSSTFSAGLRVPAVRGLWRCLWGTLCAPRGASSLFNRNLHPCALSRALCALLTLWAMSHPAAAPPCAMRHPCAPCAWSVVNVCAVSPSTLAAPPGPLLGVWERSAILGDVMPLPHPLRNLCPASVPLLLLPDLHPSPSHTATHSDRAFTFLF